MFSSISSTIVVCSLHCMVTLLEITGKYLLVSFCTNFYSFFGTLLAEMTAKMESACILIKADNFTIRTLGSCDKFSR